MLKKILLSICLFLCLKGGLGAWVLEVQLQNVNNPYKTLLYDEDKNEYCCCDGCGTCCFTDISSHNCNKSCDYVFRVCAVVNSDGGMQCAITNSEHEDDVLFAFFRNQASGRNFYSVLEYFGTDNPEGPLVLNITVEDADNNKYEFADRLNIALTGFAISSAFSSPSIHNSEYGLFNFTLSYRFYCADNYYGDDCAMYCMQTDNELGHYACDPQSGKKICLAGYALPEANCTQPNVTACGSTSTDHTTASQMPIENTSCTGWQITTVLLILFTVFSFGLCCASACLLIFMRMFRKKKSHQTMFEKSGPVQNPMYNISMQEEMNKKDPKQYEHAIFMSSSSEKNQFSRQQMPLPDTDEHYEVMMSRLGKDEGRSNFTKIGVPSSNTGKSNDFGHMYESVSVTDADKEADNKEKNNDEKLEELEEYSKLRV